MPLSDLFSANSLGFSGRLAADIASMSSESRNGGRLEAQVATEGPSLPKFALILTACLFLSYPEVVLGVKTFFFRDYGFFGYPLAFYHRESFWRVEIPLWNPLNNCGLPFLAQWNTLVLYPGSLFYLLLPLSWALGLFCLAHELLAGV